MATTPTYVSAADNLLYRFPDAQILLGPLENISFASVPDSLYYATDLLVCCDYCDNIAACSDPDLIDLILQCRSIQCDPAPGLPRCLPFSHSKWHLDIKFCLFVVPTFLMPAIPIIPPLYTLPALLTQQPPTSDNHGPLLRNLLSITYPSTESGMIFILLYQSESPLIFTKCLKSWCFLQFCILSDE